MERIATVASRLREYRAHFHLTLMEVSQKTGIPSQTLSRYELGQRKPKVEVAAQISQCLNLNPLWIQGYDVPMEKSESALDGDDALTDAIILGRDGKKVLRKYTKEQMEALRKVIDVMPYLTDEEL